MGKTNTKTTETSNSVSEFIAAIPDVVKQADSLKMVEIMQQESGFEPRMWGPSIIGFGSYHYKYATGHEGDAPLIGFSPRKAAFSLYLTCDINSLQPLLSEFGNYSTGKACIYFKRLSDINISVLKKMITLSLKQTKERYQ